MGLASSEFDSAAAQVAVHAAGLIEPGMCLGLGTGRMASAFIAALRPRIDQGLLVKGLCTSVATELRARAAGIEVLTSSQGKLDLDVDGTDEYDPGLNLLKGGGGALLREKVVAQHSRRFWVLADPSKQVRQLAWTHPLPAEILPFDWEGTAALCQARLHCRGQLRGGAATPFVTDNGNYIVDLDCQGGLADPAEVASQLNEVPGVLGHGLFLGLATACLIFDQDRVRVLGDLGTERPD